ncbi:hypothetical protein PHLGIDRAFT_477191 [Phlebiopsis gigantea 11061_1 CR5-6]|uniref:Uncharacterized protein n=1 Tax=Phlebiopsis gigantea (strain 11061_1 CR5-6) TaxID=745531 RepID=A0A0C3S9A4_PHLG1|nr:hypothetical protein PHLGIDRAFT_477191 [Phlebiopsis gigantea 11061_1 CR5-6]
MRICRAHTTTTRRVPSAFSIERAHPSSSGDRHSVRRSSPAVTGASPPNRALSSPSVIHAPFGPPSNGSGRDKSFFFHRCPRPTLHPHPTRFSNIRFFKKVTAHRSGDQPRLCSRVEATGPRLPGLWHGVAQPVLRNCTQLNSSYRTMAIAPSEPSARAPDWLGQGKRLPSASLELRWTGHLLLGEPHVRAYTVIENLHASAASDNGWSAPYHSREEFSWLSRCSRHLDHDLTLLVVRLLSRMCLISMYCVRGVWRPIRSSSAVIEYNKGTKTSLLPSGAPAHRSIPACALRRRSTPRQTGHTICR